MATEWKIRARAHECFLTKRGFEDQEEFMSRLCWVEKEFVREDYGLDSWSDELRDGAVSVWQSTYIKPPPPDEEPLKKENVEQTLRRLIEGDDPEDRNSIFILAMQLERKRLLVERGINRQPDGLKVRVYEHKQTGEMFIVPDPEIPLAEIGEVTEQVAIRLGWIQPEGAPPEVEGEQPPDAEAEAPSEEEADSTDSADPTDTDEETETDEADAGPTPVPEAEEVVV